MKKLWRLFSLSLIGAWFYYNILFIYNNRYFTGNYCFSERALFYIIPLPGVMDNYSWLLLAAWVFSGLILCAFQPRRLRPFLFYPAFFLGMAFAYYLMTTDTSCRHADRCGSQLTTAVASIQAKAFADLRPEKCDDLADFETNCQDSYTYRHAAECADIVRNLIAYEAAGMDIKNCQKTLSDCRVEYYQYFHDNLSNDKNTANGECEQKYNYNEAVQRVCRSYMDVWNKQDAKPLLTQ